jgi:hypothetical protein
MGAAVEEHIIDICDLDGEYFVNVRVWLDRSLDRYYLPRESAERLGEQQDGGAFYFFKGEVEAEPEEIEVGGQTLEAWGVSVGQFRTRPAEPGLAQS